MSIKLDQVLQAAGMTRENLEAVDTGGAQFYSFTASRDVSRMQWIYVTSTVPQVMERLSRLPTHEQGKIFQAMAALVPEVGDVETIEAPEHGNTKTKFIRVTRTKSRTDFSVHLLVTR